MSETSAGKLQPEAIPLTYRYDILFLPFLSAPFSLGHERKRGGVESEASGCIVGGNPTFSWAEPTKQKTRRPERRGIAQAVRPKKIGRRKKGNVEAQKPRRLG